MKLKIPCQIFLRRISQSEIRNSAAKTPSPKPARIPPQTPPAGGKSAEAKRKILFPRKIVFSLCRVRIEAPRTARILGGQNPERKTPFPFSEKIHPRQTRNARSVFSFGVAGVLASAWGFLRAYDFGQNHHASGACHIVSDFGNRCELGTIKTRKKIFTRRNAGLDFLTLRRLVRHGFMRRRKLQRRWTNCYAIEMLQ